MFVIPTIYLRNHRIVNPAPDARFHLPTDPLLLADEMERAGVRFLHVVDLDAPQTNGPVAHAGIFQRLTANGRFTVQVAGPIRTIDTIERYMQLGTARTVLGTIAYQKPAFTTEAATRFPHRIATEIEVRNTKVVIKGWTAAANKTALEYAAQFRSAGVSCILYSDVNDAGMLDPGNYRRIRDFASAARLPVIHAADLGTVEELEQILLLEKFGVIGTLLSKSLYEGLLDIKGVVTMAMERGLPSDESTLIPE